MRISYRGESVLQFGDTKTFFLFDKRMFCVRCCVCGTKCLGEWYIKMACGQVFFFFFCVGLVGGSVFLLCCLLFITLKT